MSGTGKAKAESFKEIKTILISQPKPERSPYYEIEQKYNVKIDWRPFIHVEGVEEKEFRKNRVYPNDFSAIIFTSKTSIDHFFRLCEEMSTENGKFSLENERSKI